MQKFSAIRTESESYYKRKYPVEVYRVNVSSGNIQSMCTVFVILFLICIQLEKFSYGWIVFDSIWIDLLGFHSCNIIFVSETIILSWAIVVLPLS